MLTKSDKHTTVGVTFVILVRNFSGPVRGGGAQHSQQLRDPDGGRVQGEAHQTRGQGHRPRQGASKGTPIFVIVTSGPVT